MSELLAPRPQTDLRLQLLATVSALSLMIAVASQARAEDNKRPTVWIDLGGQAEMLEGLSSPYTAPFMSIAPDQNIYTEDTFSRNQRLPRFSLGLEGKLSFQPEASSWVFSASLRYGRAHSNRHEHAQGAHPTGIYYNKFTHKTKPEVIPAAPIADTKAGIGATHAILDFSAGKDVGLGVWRHSIDSNISAGVRFAQFSTSSSVDISARPNIGSTHRTTAILDHPWPTFHQYFLDGQASRSFRGIGPSLSWSASAPLVGTADRGELTLDWGINGAVLFGRQKTKVSHSTTAYQLTQSQCKRFKANGDCAVGGMYSGYPRVYSTGKSSDRSRTVTVPNIGGFVALTARYGNAKVSLGYRYDTFLNTMDTGIDARKTSNLTLDGPYASVSIGFP